MSITRATLNHLSHAVKLFSQYREFYKKIPDDMQAKSFLSERIAKNESVIFLAYNSKPTPEPVGFAQLYKTFSSLNMQKQIILNDLYVIPSCRRQGFGKLLIDAAIKYSKENGIASIQLETQNNNINAIKLYESLGFSASPSEFKTFSLAINPPSQQIINSSSVQDEVKSSDIGLFSNSMDKKMNTLGKKIVVITGVTKGLGRAMTEKFIKQDCIVVGCGRTVNEVMNLQKKYGPNHIFDVVDVQDSKAVSNWADQVIRKVGTPDLLINNSSVINKNQPLWQESAEDFERLISVNIIGVQNIIRAFVPSMVSAEKGVIINMSSGWGRSAEANLGSYCASKFAIEGLTKSLALELPKTMAAIPLDPGGGINTDMLQSCLAQEANQYPTADEWAEVAVPYLLSLGPNENGQSLVCPNAPMHTQQNSAQK
jgi:NAD(P)-dependent dehydrogenase (short-subunit alcohol dehydrogenase family)/ribosomal protein S18 acetylase RimI-like enzyme